MWKGKQAYNNKLFSLWKWSTRKRWDQRLWRRGVRSSSHLDRIVSVERTTQHQQFFNRDRFFQLTAIGEKLLKDLLERVFVYFAFGTLLFILLMVFFLNICFFILSCLKPLYIFLISCLLNLVASTFTRNMKEENTSFGVRYQLQLLNMIIVWCYCSYQFLQVDELSSLLLTNVVNFHLWTFIQTCSLRRAATIARMSGTSSSAAITGSATWQTVICCGKWRHSRQTQGDKHLDKTEI